MSPAAEPRRPGVTERLWTALRSDAPPPGSMLVVQDLAAAVDASAGTVRCYLREWAACGLVSYRVVPGFGAITRAELDDPRPPLTVRDGSTAYVTHPSAPDTVWLLSRGRRGIMAERQSRAARRRGMAT